MEQIRNAREGDLEGVVNTLAGAFADDPAWGWAFPGRAEQEIWWSFLAGSALRYPCTWVRGNYEAVAVWLPPGGKELTEAEELLAPGLVGELAAGRREEVLELVESFGKAHPPGPPHYYLSLLGVHPDHRGHGIGMDLLRANLEQVDAEGAPAYLESTNPAANDRRYESVGFRKIGEFRMPDGVRTISQMWREPGGG